MLKILYVCTHNRCRSILSEAITNHLAPEHLTARSAGSQPVGEVHPLSIRYLQEAGIETHGLTSESWDAFADFDPDLVVTVCDSAAGETCPLWMGNSLKMHWGLSDPSKLEGSDEEVAEAFRTTIAVVKQRVSELADLAHLKWDKEALAAAMTTLGANR